MWSCLCAHVCVSRPCSSPRAWGTGSGVHPVCSLAVLTFVSFCSPSVCILPHLYLFLSLFFFCHFYSSISFFTFTFFSFLLSLLCIEMYLHLNLTHFAPPTPYSHLLSFPSSLSLLSVFLLSIPTLLSLPFCSPSSISAPDLQRQQKHHALMDSSTRL